VSLEPADRKPPPSPSLIAVVLLSLGIIILLIVRYAPSNDDGRKAVATASNVSEVRAEKDQITIYMVGAVHNPGVYTLPSGARAVDGLKAAGGFSDKANQAGVNLAARLHDEQMVKVPAIGEKVEIASTEEAATPSGDPGEQVPPDGDLTPASPVPGGGGSVPVKGSPSRGDKNGTSASEDQSGTPGVTPGTPPAPPTFQVSLNRASVEELHTVPGLSKKLAAAIVAFRVGPPARAFTSIDDVANLTGVREKTLRKILPYLKL
jgi:competence protein ComEA